MRYDLTRLGEHEFEDMSQALAVCVLGAGVSVFGDGPDGGREATFEGLVRYPDPAPDGRWNGYGVVQAKYKRSPAGTSDDTAWFVGMVTKELNNWTNPDKNRVKRGRLPEYLVFTTNVMLSADPGRGGIDSVGTLIDSYRDKLPLKGFAVWHHKQLCTYLDVYQAVRRTYRGFITPGDVLAQLETLLQGSAATLGPTLTSHAAKELVAQQWVRLGESGDPENQRLPLGDVAVDLPARCPAMDGDGKAPEEKTDGIVVRLLELGEGVRRPSKIDGFRRNAVVIGGPGQGKSTVGQLLCQAYRVAMLDERPDSVLGAEAARLRTHLRGEFAKLRLPQPRCRRWPIQVSLSKYGDAIAGGEDISLLRFLSTTMSSRTEITPAQLKAWLEEWPWLLVLDGFDEVAAPSVRETLINRISDFFIDAAEVDADLLVVATTRPQGYADELSPEDYDHFHLLPLSVAEALNYARRLVDVRHRSDPDLHEQVLARVNNAASELLTARLMRTPLQVTIMSLLLERRPRAPQDRYGLFEAYYSTLYDREVGKATDVARLLDDNRGHVDHLHERVGMILQTRAESAGDADAALPSEELEQLAVARLTSEGVSEAQASGLAARLVKAATDRLVLLVPRVVGTVGFEIRSLQELMAARAITKAAPEEVVTRLRLLAPSAHWRNTWLFAASRIFAEHQYQRHGIISLLAEIDSDSFLGMLVCPGARLAIDMLDEDVAAKAPVFERLLVKHALGLVEAFPGNDIDRVATVILGIVNKDPQAKALVDRRLEQALATQKRQALVAIRMLGAWTDSVGATSAAARQRISRLAAEVRDDLKVGAARLAGLHRGLASFAITPPPSTIGDPGRVITDYMRKTGYGADDIVRARRLFADLGRRVNVPSELADPDVQEKLVAVLDGLPEKDWPAGNAVYDQLLHWSERRSVATPETETWG